MIPKRRRDLCVFLTVVLGVFGLMIHISISQAMPPIQKTVLPNKLVVLLSEEHSLPFVTMQVLIDAGSRKDHLGEAGLAYMTAKSLLLGTTGRSVIVINEELDFMGASLDYSANKDYATLNLRVLKKDLAKGFDLLMDALAQPTFPEEEIQRELQKTLAAIQSAEDQPDDVAQKEFLKSLFGDRPYGHPVEGIKESLPGITREKINGFYKNFYHPNNSIITIVGDITAGELKEKLFPRLTAWPMGEIPETLFPLILENEQKTVKIDRLITQANIILGQAGVSRDNADYYALTVMNYILGGGGFASRLMQEVRNKRGLAYSVTSYFDPGKYPGSFQIVLQTKNQSAREAISISLEQLEKIRQELVTEKELEGAKKYLVGSFPLKLDSQRKLVNFFTQVEYYGLGLDYPEKYPSLINSVTKEDIVRVAKKYLHPDKYILIIVANLKEAGME